MERESGDDVNKEWVGKFLRRIRTIVQMHPIVNYFEQIIYCIYMYIYIYSIT